jgi:Flp pilus assembly protein TadG
MKTRTKIRSKLRREAGREDGAAAVEFALIVGLLAMLVFGMMEYGLAFMQVQTLRAATREGARVAAVRGTSSEISTAMTDASAGSLPGGFSGYSVSTTCDDDTVGESVTVTINNGALSSSVQDSLAIDIPLLPSITLNPTLQGTFRCE